MLKLKESRHYAARLLLLYMLVQYILPFVLALIPGLILDLQNWIIYPLTATFFIKLIVVTAYILLLPYLRITNVTFSNKIINFIVKFYSFLRKPLIILFAIISLFFVFHSLNSFRYSNILLGNQRYFLLIITYLFFKAILSVDLVFHVFLRKTNHVKKKPLTLILLFSLAISSTGVWDIIYLSFISLYWFSPSVRHHLFQKTKNVFSNFYKKGFLLLVLFLILLSALNVGRWIRGDFQTNPISPKNVQYEFSVIAKRLSVNYYNLLATSFLPYEQLTRSYNVSLMPFNTFIYRLNNYIFNIKSPEAQSLSRLNLLNTQPENVIREQNEGSSPGLISTFDYLVPNMWVALFMCLCYLTFIYNILANIFTNLEFPPTVLYLYVLMLLFNNFFQDPYEAINPFNPNFFNLLAFYLLSRYCLLYVTKEKLENDKPYKK